MPDTEHTLMVLSDKIDEMSDRMDKQFMMLAGMLDKSIEAQPKEPKKVVRGRSVEALEEEVARLKLELANNQQLSMLDELALEESILGINAELEEEPMSELTAEAERLAKLSPRQIRARERAERKKFSISNNRSHCYD